MYYQYMCDIEEEKSLRDGCSSICSRVAICCFGLAARNFGDGRGVLYTWETIIACVFTLYNVSVNSRCAHPPRANHGAVDNLEKK